MKRQFLTKALQIAEGWRNKLIPPSEIKELIADVSQERMKVCKECPHQSSNAKVLSGYSSLRPDVHCTLCGCTLEAKTACLSCECPIKKWEAVTSQEQWDEFKTIINNDHQKSQD